MPGLRIVWFVILSFFLYFTYDRDEVLVAGLILLTIFLVQEMVGLAVLSETDQFRLRINSILKRDKFALIEAREKGLKRFTSLRSSYSLKLSELENFFKLFQRDSNAELENKILNSMGNNLSEHLLRFNRSKNQRDKLLELKLANFVKKALVKR